MIATLVLQRKYRQPTHKLYVPIAFVVINYLFFLIHRVKINYYPYASAMILLGRIGGILSRVKLNETTGAKIVLIVISCSILSLGSVTYLTENHLNFEQYKNKYLVLCPYQIVWADLYSGTSEYVCSNSGFRYTWGTARARKVALEYGYFHHLKQCILISDIPVNRASILGEIESYHLPYRIQSGSWKGELVEIN